MLQRFLELKGFTIPKPSSRAVLLLIVLIIVGGAVVGLTGIGGISNKFEAAPASNSGSTGYGSLIGGVPQTFGLGNSGESTSIASQTTVTFSSTTAGEPQTTIPITRGATSGSSSSSGKSGAATPGQNSTSTGFIEFFSNVTDEVQSPQTALQKATVIAISYGGYLAYSSYTNTSSVAVLRIPEANYQSALAGIEALGNLTGLQSTSNDVSVQYTDLNATLQSLLTEQSSLLRLENESNSLNSTLILENQLQGIDAQINEIQSQILQTRLLIDYSTITATFNEKVPAPAPVPLAMKLTATPLSGLAPLSVTFNAIITGGETPYIVNYNFGDGSSYQGQTLIHTFTQAGTYNVTVTVTDNSGNVEQAYAIVHITSPTTGSHFNSFKAYVVGLLISVVEGIVEIAVVILPIALVVSAVILPFRSRLRSSKKGPVQTAT
jgi:hypothetical protein